MAQDTKRKAQDYGGGNGPASKRSKKPNKGGWWKTPNRLNNEAQSTGGSIDVGDAGIWASCARSQERRATQELIALFEDTAKSLYGIGGDKAHTQLGGDDEEEDEDVEQSIQKELADMDKSAKGKDSKALFTPVRTNIDCLIFLKTRAPIEPVPFVHRVCEDARTAGHKGRRTRYVNRLSPNVLFGKATEAGLLETARTVLEGIFDISGKRVVDKTVEGGEGGEKPDNGAAPEPAPAEGEKAPQPNAETAKQGFSFAIRESIRHHNTLKRADIIDKIANLINNERHKVDLKNPDKVIIVDVFRTVCGMSVVEGDWEQLKKYNLSELYGEGLQKNGSEKDTKAGGKEAVQKPLPGDATHASEPTATEQEGIAEDGTTAGDQVKG